MHNWSFFFFSRKKPFKLQNENNRNKLKQKNRIEIFFKNLPL